MAVFIIVIVIYLIWVFTTDSLKEESTKERIQREKKEAEEKLIRLKREERIIFQQTHLFKPNWREFQNILEENKILSIYHFTDKMNLPSIIRNGGLFSLKNCEEKGIEIKRPGSSNRSRYYVKQKQLDNFVRASFTTDNPMMYVAKKEGRITEPVFLSIDRVLIYRKDTLFSNINADSSSSEINGTLANFKTIKFSVLKKSYYDLNFSENKKYYLAEILFNQKIPARQILNLEYYRIKYQNASR